MRDSVARIKISEWSSILRSCSCHLTSTYYTTIIYLISLQLHQYRRVCTETQVLLGKNISLDEEAKTEHCITSRSSKVDEILSCGTPWLWLWWQVPPSYLPSSKSFILHPSRHLSSLYLSRFITITLQLQANQNNGQQQYKKLWFQFQLKNTWGMRSSEIYTRSVSRCHERCRDWSCRSKRRWRHALIQGDLHQLFFSAIVIKGTISGLKPMVKGRSVYLSFSVIGPVSPLFLTRSPAAVLELLKLRISVRRHELTSWMLHRVILFPEALNNCSRSLSDGTLPLHISRKIRSVLVMVTSVIVESWLLSSEFTSKRFITLQKDLLH